MRRKRKQICLLASFYVQVGFISGSELPKSWSRIWIRINIIRMKNTAYQGRRNIIFGSVNKFGLSETKNLSPQFCITDHYQF